MEARDISNEVRLGNYIIEDDTIYDYGTTKTLRKISEEDFRVRDKDWSDHWDMIKPVKVDEEILTKSNFIDVTEEDDESKCFELTSGRKSIRAVILQDDLIMILHQNNVGMNFNEVAELEFLHQLQNLFFCLTGEELEFKI